MRDEQPNVIVLPRFGRWSKTVSIIVGAVWLFEFVLLHADLGSVALAAIRELALIGSRVFPPRFELWRVLTYVWIDDPTDFGVLWSVVGLWLFGSPIEREAGARRLVELMVAGALGGVVATLIGAYSSIELLDDPVLGMAPVTSALLAGWGFQYAERPVSFLGTWTILGKNLAVALGALTVLLAFLSRSAASLASVGGLLAGALWMWLRLRLRRHTKSGRFRVVQGDRETPPGKRWLN